MRRGTLIILAAGLGVLLMLAGTIATVASQWYGAGPLPRAVPFIVARGATMSSLAGQLEQQGAISSARGFRMRARLFGSSEVKAGEYELPAHASESRIIAVLTGGETLNRFVTIPEGMPSVMVFDRLNARPLLTGDIAVPAEGTVLPDTYPFERGESRASVLKRMQDGMTVTLARAWANRSPDAWPKTPREALILASIVEKETGKAAERPLVAALYSNRLRKGMLLQADPTIIYPITKGKPLGRRIRQSEIQAVNDYNTYTMVGLPKGPITNPGKAAIEAVLHPAKTSALYMVADGTGGHVFAETLEAHNANVAKWFALRRQRGDL